jgi:hypothetical protein
MIAIAIRHSSIMKVLSMMVSCSRGLLWLMTQYASSDGSIKRYH